MRGLYQPRQADVFYRNKRKIRRELKWEEGVRYSINQYLQRHTTTPDNQEEGQTAVLFQKKPHTSGDKNNV